MGIEPNEHRTSSFQGKYSYQTDHSENPTETQFSQCYPYVWSDVGCGILRFCESQCFSGVLERTVGLK